MHSKKQPVFILGEQRSGTNLLRLILNNSSRIVAPHPPHVIDRLRDLLPKYGELSTANNLKTLIDDICTLIETNPIKWDQLELNRNQILNRITQRNIWGIYQTIMDEYADIHDADIWICKSRKNVEWINEIEDHFNNQAKYVYLFRDPRDVTLSFMNTMIGHKHAYCISKRWTQIQKKCLTHRAELDKERFFSLKYESLIKNPEELVGSLCSFLKVEFDSNMLEYYKSEEAMQAAQVSMQWGNLNTPIINNNSKKYREEMNQADLLIIESNANLVMHQLGYDLQNKNEELLQFTDAQIDHYIEKDHELKTLSLDKLKQEEYDKREVQLQVLRDIKKRLNDHAYV